MSRRWEGTSAGLQGPALISTSTRVLQPRHEATRRPATLGEAMGVHSRRRTAHLVVGSSAIQVCPRDTIRCTRGSLYRRQSSPILCITLFCSAEVHPLQYLRHVGAWFDTPVPTYTRSSTAVFNVLGMQRVS